MPLCSLSRLVQPNSRRCAQTTVEFSLILLPFFILIFATIDIALYFFYDNCLQNAMRETTHFTASGGIIVRTDSMGNNLTEYINGVKVPLPIPDPLGGTAPFTNASRDECAKLYFRSNCILPNILWRSNVVITSQPTSLVTNTAGQIINNLPSTVDNGSVAPYLNESLSPYTNGPGNIGDFVQVVGTVPVASITYIANYLSTYARPDKAYVLRASTITVNEPNKLNFQSYPATNPTEF